MTAFLTFYRRGNNAATLAQFNKIMVLLPSGECCYIEPQTSERVFDVLLLLVFNVNSLKFSYAFPLNPKLWAPNYPKWGGELPPNT